MPVKVLTNHKDLEYFMTTKKLTPRQARWAEFLSEFNFVVTYQSGNKNDKADILTRKPNQQPTNEEDKQQKHRMQILLPLKRVKLQLIEVSKPRKKPYAEQFAKPQAKNLEEFTNYAEAERYKKTKQEENVEDKPEKTEEFGKLHAAELHAELEKKTDKQEDLLTLSDQVKKAN